ncbi:MAG: hypothetical protein IT370_32985 [Deltaproteobacteria bacterium]|nr:hypothetical protein [Deltaproteobacteria bacterium]
MSAPAHASGPRSRCARCDAPIYTGEDRCHYCGGRDEPAEMELLNVFLLAAMLLGILGFAVLAR